MVDATLRSAERAYQATPSPETLERYVAAVRHAGGDPHDSYKLRAAMLEHGAYSFQFQQFLREFSRHGMSRNFCSLVFGPGKQSVSIQASATHYSTPRKTFEIGNVSYSAWEIAMERGLLDETASHLEIDWESEGWSVAGWIPSETVQALCNWLYVKYGEPKTKNRE